MDTNGFEVGDRVRASFAISGRIVRFEKERWGIVAVIDGGGYNRKIPVTGLEKI